MNELTTEIKALQEETLNNLKSSKANNTIRAYKSDFKDFNLFCLKHDFKSLPSEPKIISLYLTYLSTKNSKMSTLRRRLVSISMVHRMKGYYLDTKHPIIIENILGIKRTKGSYQTAKKPILINNLKSIINVIDKEEANNIKKIRDKTLILLGFSGGFRRTELISIDFDDLEFVSEGVKIIIKRSKTDQFGEGQLKGIPYFAASEYCPVRHLQEWIKLSGIRNGSVFRRLNKGSSISENRLNDQSVALIIKKYLNLIGVESKNYSGHSLRSGFATSTAESGADERSIMAMTGHKSTQMVRRYIRESNLFKNNALNKIKI